MIILQYSTIKTIHSERDNKASVVLTVALRLVES